MKQKALMVSAIILMLLLIANINFDRLPKNTKIDALVVYKSERKLLVFSKGKLIKTYKIALGKSPIGSKQFQGDNKTPEGVYFINGKNGHSIAYKNLGLSYPNSNDISSSKGKSTGGDIKIHGLMNNFWFVGNFHRIFDWTNGCIAVNNSEMEELFNAVSVGTKIEIKP
jgi:murein L,D-transpeptidase YafK